LDTETVTITTKIAVIAPPRRAKPFKHSSPFLSQWGKEKEREKYVYWISNLQRADSQEKWSG
jgi:hypothetical protein